VSSEPELVWPFDYAVQRAQDKRTGEWEILLEFTDPSGRELLYPLSVERATNLASLIEAELTVINSAGSD
jgi:hypothetical protein